MPRISADQKKAKSETKPIETPPPAPPVQVIERRIETVSIEVPLGEPPHDFGPMHLDFRFERRHANTFARLRQALRDQGAKTKDGKRVETKPDVMRWLMEQLGSC